MTVSGESGMTCLRCGGDNDARRSFCRSCGLPFTTPEIKRPRATAPVLRRPPTRPAPRPKPEPVERVGYSGPEVMRLTGVTYRQLDYWDRTSLVSPSLEQANGSGTQRRYDDVDVRVVGVMKQLLDAGVSLQRIRLMDLYSLPADECVVMMIGEETRVVRTADEIIEGLRSGDAAQVVRVAALATRAEREAVNA